MKVCRRRQMAIILQILFGQMVVQSHLQHGIQLFYIFMSVKGAVLLSQETSDILA